MNEMNGPKENVDTTQRPAFDADHFCERTFTISTGQTKSEG